MKKLLIITTLLFLQTTLTKANDINFFPQKVNNYKVNDLLSTKLVIFVLDKLGNRQEGVSVTLYNSKEDYLKEKNPLSETFLTDNKGRVVFKKIQPQVYFIHAKKGDLNNNNNGVKTAKLDKGKANKINIIID